MRRSLVALMLGVSLAALAEPTVETPPVPPPFSDPALEHRFEDLTRELRCLVCQNQSIADSHAPLAADLRREVHAMLERGASDAEIIDFMVTRYGDFVLYKPPVTGSTWLLWFGPLLLLAGGALVVARVVRERSRQVGEDPPA